MQTRETAHIKHVPLLGSEDSGLLEISRKGLLSLNLQEMKAIQSYFDRLGRDPTDVELETIAQTWSEHCKHKKIGRASCRERVCPKV